MEFSEMSSEEYPNLELPACIFWTAEEVAKWIESIGFPYYKECFEKNFITGRKLILLEASHLPLMGITIFEDIKIITAAIRKLLNVKKSEYFRNISLPPKEPWALFLEMHSKTGKNVEKIKYVDFLRNRGMKHTDM